MIFVIDKFTLRLLQSHKKCMQGESKYCAYIFLIMLLWLDSYVIVIFPVKYVSLSEVACSVLPVTIKCALTFTHTCITVDCQTRIESQLVKTIIGIQHRIQTKNL